MKTLILMTAALVSVNAFAASSALESVLASAKKDFAKSIRFEAKHENGNFCGYEGWAYTVTVSQKKSHRAMDKNDQLTVAESWEEIEHYVVTDEEYATSGSKFLMKDGQCLE